jgi:hypothetical protein
MTILGIKMCTSVFNFINSLRNDDCVRCGSVVILHQHIYLHHLSTSYCYNDEPLDATSGPYETHLTMRVCLFTVWYIMMLFCHLYKLQLIISQLN